ncbi:unnamed protein product [Parascedosporium putredinis]|uniref:Uncharacterized protein n=1 Tax=Parascedosporium putredinis TaxID=1442378 RepID=A0A9P1H8C2_9PEZI|nr:unnamed protein product [Parascedosporium putredinis]CAI7999624.1 unnamed protein product [Parascedosporium putredinis]
MSHADDPPPNLSEDEIEPIDRAAAAVTPPPLPSPSLPSPVSAPAHQQSPSVNTERDASSEEGENGNENENENEDEDEDEDESEDGDEKWFEDEKDSDSHSLNTHDHGDDGDEESNADHFGDSTSEQDPITLDSKDVLLQRLGDLIDRLNLSDSGFRDENLSALHSKVDEMENVLEGTEHRAQLHRQRPNPSSLLRSRFSDLTMALHESPLPKPEASSPVESEAVRKRYIPRGRQSHIGRARQEESEHIHGLLIERAERAAQRIAFLEEHIHNLESEFRTYDAELSNLRIALKAIEVQCPPPSNMDEDLRRSIQNWKTDWKNVKEKRVSRLTRESSAFTSIPATPR